MSKSLQNRLRLQALGIEETFSRHGLSVQVEGGIVGSHVTSYRVRVSEDAGWMRLALPELQQDLAETLGVRDVAVRREFGQVRVEVSHVHVPGASLLTLLQETTLPPLVALLGAADQQPLLLDMTAPESSHVLILGEAGAGKSALLRSIALSLVLHSRQAQLQVVCFVPSRSGRAEASLLQDLAHLPHLMTSLVSEMEDVREVLAFLVAEIVYRRQAGVRLPHLVVLLDQMGDLYGDGDAEMHHALQRLLAEGVAVGIHLLAASRPPASAQHRRMLQADWPVRVAGRLALDTAQELGVVEASRLSGPGDFLIYSGDSVGGFRGAHVDDYDLQLCLDKLQKGRPISSVRERHTGPGYAAGQPFAREDGDVRLIFLPV